MIAMLYTTGQLRSAFCLSKQQWRSYREALSPLAKDQGRSACFTAADLLATSVVHRVSTSLSIPLSVFTTIAAPLFELCAAWPWPQLERSNLVIDLQSNRVELVDGERRITGAAVALFVELAPLVAELRQHLLAGAVDPQRDLTFPPMIAGTRR
jgi:hypothetical protein